jgi:hypothetical protein
MFIQKWPEDTVSTRVIVAEISSRQNKKAYTADNSVFYGLNNMPWSVLYLALV